MPSVEREFALIRVNSDGSSEPRKTAQVINNLAIEVESLTKLISALDTRLTSLEARVTALEPPPP